MKHTTLTSLIVRVAGLLTALILVINPAAASELQDEYAAYQEAAAVGDLHAALPHAQRAYELGLEQFGEDSINAGLLALNYGQVLCGITHFRQAEDVLRRAYTILQSSGGAPEDRHLAGYLLSIAEVNYGDVGDARTFVDALRLEALEDFGTVSMEHAETLYLRALTVIRDDFRHAPRRNRFRRRYELLGSTARRERTSNIGRGYIDQPVEIRNVINRADQDISHAENILSQLGQSDSELAGRLALAHGQLRMWSYFYEQAVTYFDQALRILRARPFTDDDLMEAYSERIFTAQLLEDADTVEQLALEAYERGQQRCDGGSVVIFQTLPPFPPDVDQFSVRWTRVDFTVNAEGRPENVELHDGWDRNPQVAVEALAQFHFVPARSNCQNVATTHGRVTFVIRRWL